MSGAPTRRGRRGVAKRASESDLLLKDVAAMISETERVIGREAEELAHDIIVVVRERTLREIESYARENIR
jgi:hypothetical protein